MAAAGADWKVRMGVLVRDELYHYGVLGMKWGVRRTHEDYVNAHTRKSVRSMSTKELRDRTNRLQAENQYRAAKRDNSAVRRAVTSFIKASGLITASVAAYKVYDKYAKAVYDKYAKAVIDKAADKIPLDFTIDDIQK